MEKDLFYIKVAQALSGCQLVEQELKLYLTEAFDLVRKCINGKMTFEIKGEDYENASLERLIETFRKITANQELVDDLRKFKDERNFLSHQGIAHCLDYEGDLCYTSAEGYEHRLNAISSKAETLRLAIHEEANKFRGDLWFDDLTEGKH